MTGPFIFVATNRLKPGALEAERQRVPELCNFVEASEPRLIAFNEYVNDEGTEVAVVQVHPDAESMRLHMGIVRERAAQAYAQTLDVTASIQVFGDARRRGAGDARAASRLRRAADREGTSPGRVHAGEGELSGARRTLSARRHRTPVRRRRT
jgi:hypothetical protein